MSDVLWNAKAPATSVGMHPIKSSKEVVSGAAAYVPWKCYAYPSCRILENLAALEELCLSGNALTALPPSVWTLKRLRSLDLSENRFAALPADISGLANLEVWCNVACMYENVSDGPFQCYVVSWGLA